MFASNLRLNAKVCFYSRNYRISEHIGSRTRAGEPGPVFLRAKCEENVGKCTRIYTSKMKIILRGISAQMSSKFHGIDFSFSRTSVFLPNIF